MSLVKYATPLPGGNTAGLSIETVVVLVSNDGVKYAVSKAAIVKESSLIREMLPEDVPTEVVEIPVPAATGDILKYVATFIEHNLTEEMKTIEMPLRHDLREILDPWHKEFVYTDLVKSNLDHATLYHVTGAANFLACGSLFDLCCASVASLLRNKDRKAVREQLFDKPDFTPEEWEATKKQFAFAFPEDQAAPAAAPPAS